MNPLEELKKIYSALDLENFDNLNLRAVEYLNSMKTYKKNVFDLDEETKVLIATKWRKNFDKYGYMI